MPDLLEVSFLLLSGIEQIAPYGAFVTHTPSEGDEANLLRLAPGLPWFPDNAVKGV